MDVFDRIAERSESRGFARNVINEIARRNGDDLGVVKSRLMAETLRCEMNTVWVAIRWLEAHGEIEVVRPTHRAYGNSYKVTL